MTTAMQMWHPVTGVALPDDDTVLLTAVLDADVEIRELYGRAREIRDLRDTLTRTLADRGKYELPPRRGQTSKQARIQACPRCGDRDEMRGWERKA